MKEHGISYRGDSLASCFGLGLAGYEVVSLYQHDIVIFLFVSGDRTNNGCAYVTMWRPSVYLSSVTYSVCMHYCGTMCPSFATVENAAARLLLGLSRRE